MKTMMTTMAAGLLFLLSSFVEAAPVALHLDKTTVEIGTFYNGTTVLAEGTVPPGSEAVVRVSGKKEVLHLKKKGKVGGLLWMNTGDLTIEDAPRIYMVYASAQGQDILTSPQLGVGLDSLRDRIRILPAGADQGLLFNEFIKLKKHDAVYAEFPGSVTYGEETGEGRRFQAALQVPPRMGEDSYAIEVMAVREGQVIGQAAAELQVKMGGFPEQLSRLAFQRSLLYGILSVVIAVAGGFLMGALFRGKGGGAH